MSDRGHTSIDWGSSWINPLAFTQNPTAISLYFLFSSWEIAVAASAGPAAVAMGARLMHTKPSSRQLITALAIAAIRAAVPRLLITMLKLLRLDRSDIKARDRRLLVKNYVISTPAFGSSPLVSLVLAMLALLALLGAWLLAGTVFFVGLASAAEKMLVGKVSDVVAWSAAPVGFFLTAVHLMKCSSVEDMPLEIPFHAIAGLIFIHTTDALGIHLCPHHVAASAGAIFGTVLHGRLLLPGIVFLVFRIYDTSIDDTQHRGGERSRLLGSTRIQRAYGNNQRAETKQKDHYWASKLFGKPKTLDEEFNGPRYEVKQQDVQAALQVEREEQERHPDMAKVYFSRPAGLDNGKHYVMIIRHRKYELRDRFTPYYNTALISLTPCTEEEVPPEQFAEHSFQLHNLETDKYGIYNVFLVGWTTATHEEIDKVCADAIRGWKYNLLFRTRRGGNCQHYVRLIADKIIKPQYQASNWPWFHDDIYGPIQKAEYNKFRDSSGYVLRFFQLSSPLSIFDVPKIGF